MEADVSRAKNLNESNPIAASRNVNKTKGSANQDSANGNGALEQAAEKAASVIHFPHDRSAGDLYLVENKGKSRFIGQALGEVHVPVNGQVFLYYNYDSVYGCSRLARLSCDALYGLSFLGTEITDPDVQFLKHLESLNELDISCTGLGDECLEHLKDLANLRKLNLSSTQITGKGVELLSQFKGLTELVLDDTKIGDQSLLKLSSLARLETLSLSFTQVTSRGLAKIKSLKNLKRLRLNSTSVSNAGIDFLIRLNKLEELWLRSTRVTYSGLTELKKHLPDCQIIH